MTSASPVIKDEVEPERTDEDDQSEADAGDEGEDDEKSLDDIIEAYSG